MEDFTGLLARNLLVEDFKEGSWPEIFNPQRQIEDFTGL